MNKTCENCKYKKQLNKSLICIKYAPKPLTQAATEDKLDKLIREARWGVSEVSWPVVNPNYSCGEFEWNDTQVIELSFYERWYGQQQITIRNLKKKVEKLQKKLEQKNAGK